MTQQGNWQQEIARLAQRQDQLERQHRETTTRVDTLKRMPMPRRWISTAASIPCEEKWTGSSGKGNGE